MKIEEAWEEAVGKGAEDVLGDVLARYSEPHRRYHTVRHVEQVLGVIQDLTPRPSRVLLLAAVLHDVVYDPASRTNEEESSEYTHRLGGVVPEDVLAETRALILQTKTHEALSEEGRVLLDADLSILAAEEAAYREYQREVREEYMHVPEDLWRTGRRKVLEGLLARQQLYRTEQGGEMEARARANMLRELEELKEP